MKTFSLFYLLLFKNKNMEITHILAKASVYSLFAFAFYTWNKIRIIYDFNKRSMFFLIVLLACFYLVIYVDFIEKINNEIKNLFFQYANYSSIILIVIFNLVQKKKDKKEDVYFKPKIALLIFLTIFVLYRTFFMNI